MRHITYSEAMTGLRKAVRAKGSGYTYPHCQGQYTRQGLPACLVGHVFADLGVTIPETENNLTLATLLRYGYFSCDLQTFALLHEAQRRNDLMEPWGEAVMHAIGWADMLQDPRRSDDATAVLSATRNGEYMPRGLHAVA